ncbi:MAG TPA: arabinofuranosidase catalytic domain-containing protein, partial [Terracidiphilus sp.]|nr:arabinofuranosidase catalytic domain-containing protein [Terracidiphilus sp.]
MQLKPFPCRKFLSLAPALLAIAMTTPTASLAQEGAPLPCDLFAAATPCVAAISTTRALYRGYAGPLY